ncbi:MAG: hypothetical protein CMO55_10680 [Verrucomicrobiales bacterium]|nr:hypothetical protein [Verrucomicrobiales bacterium]
MNGSSPIFEDWNTLFSECYAIAGQYFPHSRWSHCTRYVAYEPGHENLGRFDQKMHGRFTFESANLVELLRNVCETKNRECPEYCNLFRWLSQADRLDERITILPHQIGLMTRLIEDLLERDTCEVYCRACSRPIYGDLIREVGNRTRSTRIRCQAKHILLMESIPKFHSSTEFDKWKITRWKPEVYEVVPPRLPSLWFYDPHRHDNFKSDDINLMPEKTGRLRNHYIPDTIIPCRPGVLAECSDRPLIRLD